MKTHESYSPTAGLALDLWATNGQNLVTLSLLARRAVTEQEEQEMAASVHAFASESRRLLTECHIIPCNGQCHIIPCNGQCESPPCGVHVGTKEETDAETHDGSGGDDATRREAERDAGASAMGAGARDARCPHCGDLVELPAGGPEQSECEHKDVAPICDRHGEVVARECQDCGKWLFILH